MTKLLEDAVEVLRSLPENVQAAAARAIIDYGSSYDESLQLSDEQTAEVEQRMDDPNRTFLSATETTHRLRHFGV